MPQLPTALPAKNRMRRPHLVPKATVTTQDIRLPGQKVVAGGLANRGVQNTIGTVGGSTLVPAAANLASSQIAAIGALSFSSSPTQAACQALRDAVVTALNAVLPDLQNRRTDITQLVTDLNNTTVEVS